MTLFTLAVWSCVTYTAFNGDYTHTCKWTPAGGPYASLALCERYGEKQIGTPIYSDIAEHRVIEKYTCTPMSVISE